MQTQNTNPDKIKNKSDAENQPYSAAISITLLQNQLTVEMHSTDSAPMGGNAKFVSVLTSKFNKYQN